MKKKYYVYKMYDSNDTLVYVGETFHIDRRMKQHFGRGRGHLDRKQYDSVVKVLYHECSNETDMSMKETYFITSEKPLYNTIHSKNEPPSFDVGAVKWEEYEGLQEIREKEKARLDKKFPYINRRPSFIMSERAILEGIKKHGASEFAVYMAMANSRSVVGDIVTSCRILLCNLNWVENDEGKKIVKKTLQHYYDDELIYFIDRDRSPCFIYYDYLPDISKYKTNTMIEAVLSEDEKEVEVSYESLEEIYHKLGNSRNKIYALYCVFCALSKSSNKQFKTSLEELEEITGFATTTISKYLKILEEDFGAIETKIDLNSSIIKCKLTKKYYDVY